MRLELDGHSIKSPAAFHDAVRTASGIGFYGRNLDALWDLLTGLVERPVRIVWTNADVSEAAMGDEFHRIARIIREAETYYPNDDFRFEMSR